MHKGNVSIHLMFTIAYLVLATVSSMPFGLGCAMCW